MTSIATIYSVWGGNAEAMAADIGETGITVRQWRNRNSIPPRAWAAIITKAAEKGVTLAVSDFGPLPSDFDAIEQARQAERNAA